jgi:hypothetical protein
MGRWAQRQRGGGGITPLNRMIEARISGLAEITVTYLAAINAAALDVDSFITLPGTFDCTGIAAFTTRQIKLTFTDAVTAQTSLSYSGSTPGIQTPQTILLI